LLALQAYERALELDPAIPELLSRMGQWHLRNGSPDQGIQYFEQAVKLSNSWRDAMYNLAVAQAKAGRTAEATVTLDKILRKDPSFARAVQLRTKLGGSH
jgi:Tfp pilus assembly protein PilF